MEVHVNGVPAQSNGTALRNFLRHPLTALSITNFHCHKPKERTFASLTFLNIDEGQRFLAHHGQVKRGPRQRQTVNTKPNHLMFCNRPIYFSKSFRDPNPFLLRTLKLEDEERKKDQHRRISSVSNSQDQPDPSKVLSLKLECTAVECGFWTPFGSEIVYAPQLEWPEEATAVFGERVMMLSMKSGLRIDFRYTSTLEINTEDSQLPAITFTMWEAPRFFQKISDPIADLLGKLALVAPVLQSSPPSDRNGVLRHRLPHFGSEHQPLAGACLVYRITLRQHQFSSLGVLQDIGGIMESLGKARGLPLVVHRKTHVHKLANGPLQPFSQGYRILEQTLSSLSCELPFILKFQIQRLAQGGYLHPMMVVNLLPEFGEVIRRSSVNISVSATRKFSNRLSYVRPDSQASDFQLESLIELLRVCEDQARREAKSGFDEAVKFHNVANIHRARVTPSGIHLHGPEPESNNRILRKYPDHHDYFLRVQFCDEDGQPVRFNPRISNEHIFHGKFKQAMKCISIAGRAYSFLGFSHSSLRAQSCWFMAPFISNGTLLFDRMVISELGNFSDIRSPAKCAARIGQAFSDTRTAVRIDLDAVELIPDVTFNDRVFSDGVGTISQPLLEKIWEQLPKKAKSQHKPTCLQIRFQGAKGMISLDSRLQGDVLRLRPSMVKYGGSTSADIEICEAAYKPLPMYLNRQLIKILEDMGVEESFFLDLQAREIERLRMATDNPLNASKFLKDQSIGKTVFLPSLITGLAMRNLDFRRDGFLRDTVELALLAELRKLKHKTRIPVEKGYHLHGLMDETNLLEEGQVFCVAMEEGVARYITGKNIIVSRAPGLHPGDVQLVEGVMPPDDSPLLKLSNCICFSQKGERDLPSQLSGGDIDGDRYYILWDERATPKQRFTPADYPIQKPLDIGRAVVRDDMTDFFINFMETDQLGRIAVLHRVLADQYPEGTPHADCIGLAGMHSTAVDFSKTGVPVDMTLLPRSNPWRPDFEAPGPHVSIENTKGISLSAPEFCDPLLKEDEDDEFTTYRYYPSTKVLGKLYRAIDERVIFEGIQQRALAQGLDRRSDVMDIVWKYVLQKVQGIQWEYFIDAASDIRNMYEDCLYNIMVEYSQHPSHPLSELEAFTGNILGKTGVPTKHQRELSQTMKEKFEEDTTFIVNCILNNGDSDEPSEDALARSVACFAISLEDMKPYTNGQQLCSFKYVAAAICLKEVNNLPGWEDLEVLDIF